MPRVVAYVIDGLKELFSVCTFWSIVNEFRRIGSSIIGMLLLLVCNEAR